MIDWEHLISSDKKAVVNFATHKSTATDFQKQLSGKTNPARCAVRKHGSLYARRLARKALRRRGISV